jgi:hypothetical protein
VSIFFRDWYETETVQPVWGDAPSAIEMKERNGRVRHDPGTRRGASAGMGQEERSRDIKIRQRTGTGPHVFQPTMQSDDMKSI